jgi:hypothetical protein
MEIENSKKQRGFKKGVSGNPGGRPKLPPEIVHVRELARKHTTAAIDALVEVLASDSASGRVAAANAILDRGWGKAEQPITGEDGGALKIDLSITRPKVDKAEWLILHGMGTPIRPTD